MAISLAECQIIVVRNTPQPENFADPNQLLAELGVQGPREAGAHRAGIVEDVKSLEHTIDAADIQSGPGVSVAICRNSVHNNAH